MILPIYSITPFTMLDFPERTACIIWFAGCNMRCHYCHNPDIIKGRRGKMSVEETLSFLEKRKGLLDGVVLSGGEASIYVSLIDFARTLKQMGYGVKLDTNGTRPKIVAQMLEEGLLDYVALDYKAPACKFRGVTGNTRFKSFDDTLSTLCAQDKVPFEVRTTVHTALLDEADIGAIIDDLSVKNYRGTYYVQNFINNGDPILGDLPAQARTLDVAALPKPAGFRVEARNF